MTEQPERPRGVETIQGARTRRVRARYGGFSWGVDFIAFAVASFFTVVFLAIVGALIGGVGYQLDAPVPPLGGAFASPSQPLGVSGVVGALVAVALAYLIGGYAAGRMARFDGVQNGLGAVIWTIVVGIILGLVGAVFGTKSNVASQLHLTINTTALTLAGLISLAITLLVMVVAVAIGGRLGAAYNHKIDRAAGVMS